MLCENCFCIYQKDNKCTLQEIWIDIQGHCQECIYAAFEKKMLENKKKRALNRYKTEYTELD